MQETFSPLPFRQHYFFPHGRIFLSQLPRKGSGVQMLTSMETYLRQGQRQLRRWALDPRVRSGARIAACGGSGFLLSAAELHRAPQPIALGLICAVTGWRAPVMGLGAILGYRLFWGQAGIPGVLWSLTGILLALFAGKRSQEDLPLLLPALAAVSVAVTGLILQFFREQAPPFPVFLLQVGIAPGAAWFFPRLLRHRDSLSQWIAGAVGVLALAGTLPVPYLNPGCIAAGVLTVTGSFPAAALAGLGLDLARITPLPMAATLSAAYFLRMIPWPDRRIRFAAPAMACLGMMALCGIVHGAPLPGLLLGGALGLLLPPRPEGIHRRGETGVAQVRLEMTAGVLAQVQQLLLEQEEAPIDQEALLEKARCRACGSCSARNVCRDQNRLRMTHLHSPEDFSCRKPGRIREELHRSRDQMRSLKADRQRQSEYRYALIQQYQFLAEYLRRLSDQLPRKGDRLRAYYKLEVSVRSFSREPANGDRCLTFAGTGCRYYILLCDGMGTGLGAAHEGQSTGELLQQLLTAGFPAEYAFRSVNSLLVLRGAAGAVTLDLAEIRLDTGRITLYKWGAAPSWVLRRAGAEKIGTATPPPGISLTETRETVLRLSLHRGESLILISDGAEVGEYLRRMEFAPDAPPGELADRLLEEGRGSGEDDATVVVLRLRPRQPSA